MEREALRDSNSRPSSRVTFRKNWPETIAPELSSGASKKTTGGDSSFQSRAACELEWPSLLERPGRCREGKESFRWWFTWCGSLTGDREGEEEVEEECLVEASTIRLIESTGGGVGDSSTSSSVVVEA